MSPTETPGSASERSPPGSHLETEELVEEIAKLAKTGASSAQIGAVLRDMHAVPSVRTVTGKRMKAVL